jgi:hypothetical protein
MSDPQVQPLSEIKLDESNLYKEEVFTDLRVGSLKQLTPVTKDGERDKEHQRKEMSRIVVPGADTTSKILGPK